MYQIWKIFVILTIWYTVKYYYFSKHLRFGIRKSVFRNKKVS